MRLSELIFEEDRHKNYLNHLIKDIGIKQLGAGSYANVFQHPTYHNVAVKVVRREDPLYMKFIRLCIKYQGNPWLPRIISIHDIDFYKAEKDILNIPSSGKEHIIFFEKLRPATSEEITKALLFFLDFKEQNIISFDVLEYIKHKRTSNFSFLLLEDWELISKKHPRKSCRELAKIIIEAADGVEPDIHDENVMIRNDGQLVFTDPLAS